MKNVAILFTICLCSCNNINETTLTQNVWQWESGFKISEGDFVEFEDSNYGKFRNNIIYYKNVEKARIESIDEVELHVASIKAGERGVYINTREFSK